MSKSSKKPSKRNKNSRVATIIAIVESVLGKIKKLFK